MQDRWFAAYQVAWFVELHVLGQLDLGSVALVKVAQLVQCLLVWLHTVIL